MNMKRGITFSSIESIEEDVKWLLLKHNSHIEEKELENNIEVQRYSYEDCIVCDIIFKEIEKKELLFYEEDEGEFVYEGLETEHVITMVLPTYGTYGEEDTEKKVECRYTYYTQTNELIIREKQ